MSSSMLRLALWVSLAGRGLLAMLVVRSREIGAPRTFILIHAKSSCVWKPTIFCRTVDPVERWIRQNGGCN
jgi:hypothetical protein